MAIQFVNNIDFNLNQAQSFVVENLAADPSPGGSSGRIIYNTSDSKIKVFNGSAWEEVGGGDVEGSGTATEIAFWDSTNSITSDSNLYWDNTNKRLGIGSGASTPSQKLDVDGNIQAEGGTFNTGISIGNVPSTNKSYDVIFDTGGTYPYLLYFELGAPKFSVSAATYGIYYDNYHPEADTLTTARNFSLTGDVTAPVISFDGSANVALSTTIAAGAVEFSMLDSAAVITQAEGIENNDNDTTIPTSAAVKAYADSLVVGGLIYQGGYDASTNTPDLDGPPSPNNIKKGWTYTVTVDGSFFTEQVRVGDVLIAESDAPTTLADWTTVQNNVDLASLTQVGIGNVNAGTGISVSYSNGTATVSKDVTNQSARRIILNSAIPGISRAEAGGITTFTLDMSSSTFFGTGASALDVMVEVVGNNVNNGETVYAEIGRSGSNMTIKFTGSVAISDYQALLNYVA